MGAHRAQYTIYDIQYIVPPVLEHYIGIWRGPGTQDKCLVMWSVFK